MKKAGKFICIVLVIGAVAGYWYFQKNKRHLVKDSIDTIVMQKTDSLYYIHYDSSKIDELTGSAAFYNVSLQSDSLQKVVLKSMDSLPSNLYNIHVDEVNITGVDVPALLQNNKVSAKKIFLNRPFIDIINTGSNKTQPFNHNDTMELYKRILGKFKSIQADSIQISNGTVLVTDRNGRVSTTLKNINVQLNGFLVDSSHNYKSVISYFIKDMKASVENIQFAQADNNSRVIINDFEYDALQKKMQVKEIQQYRIGNSTALLDLNNIVINGLNTNAFVLHQRLKAGMVTCSGGLVTIYRGTKSKRSRNKEIDFSSKLISEVEVAGINLDSTKIIIEDTIRNTPPIILNNVKFVATKVDSVINRSEISDIINNAEWQLSIGDFALCTHDKLYTITTTGVKLNNVNKNISIKNIKMQTHLSEQEFAKKSIHQHDRYDLSVDNILLEGVNYEAFINDNILEVDKASLQPTIKIFNDRTLPADTSNKVGKYPNQQLANIHFPFYIKRIQVINGYVGYKEKAAKSLQKGTVFFSNINAAINNITNMQDRIKQNEHLSMNATALFMGAGKLSSKWILPLNKADTAFTVTGSLGKMNTAVLNPLIEPLAMVSINKGDIQKLDFNMAGGNYRSSVNVAFLYNDVNIKVLKKDAGDDGLKTNGLQSLFANALLNNSNPQKGETRTGTVTYDRDIHKSFFNFLWKSVFAGVKKIAYK
ncbi:MAG TPA: hypothetical protein VK718_03580 [Ferruginibacter sp.]|jgi:hypothetical protein|nr:hypothetical protein [Ferruginibacter sp.]